MKLSKHNLSNSWLWTSKLGELKVTNLMEILPNDKVTYSNQNFVRFSPMVAPVMSMIYNYTHSWYVPTWLLWDKFEDFITGRDETLRIPKVKYLKDACVTGSLWDVLGLPVSTSDQTVPTDFEVNALPFKAYWFIFDYFYRDEDLQPDLSFEIIEPLIDKWIDGSASLDDVKKIVKVPKVSWRKDIYTTARPWQQKGSEVVIPLDIKSDGKPFRLQANNQTPETSFKLYSVNTGVQVVSLNGAGQMNSPLLYGGEGLQGVGLTVNKLALASALARRRYKDGRYGSRYAELLQSMGAKSADARLFMPQYLGGGKKMMEISEVVQTSSSTETSNLGDMGGHGIGSFHSSAWRREFNEHGYQITFSFFRPDAVYNNLTERLWSQDIREDFFFKEFENIGLQEIMTRELFPSAPSDEVFGWNDAYYYYRQILSKVTGEFRTLDKHWHLARIFKDKPVLNSSFIECNPSNRIFADLVNDTLKINTNNFIKAYRMVAKTAKLRL